MDPARSTRPAGSLRLDLWMTLKASDLGLKTLGGADEIDLRIGASAIAPPLDDHSGAK